MLDVAVIGSGVSGLATAYHLKQHGLDVVVLERQTRPGGNAVSERFGGFLMEHGPSTIAATSAPALEFSRRLGLDAGRCELGEGVRRRYLVGDGRLRGIPLHPMGFLTSNYLPLGSRLRLMAEFAVPRGGGGETVAEFFERRFGRTFVDRVIDPLVGGIYAGRADALSLAAAFPNLLELERKYGSVTHGMLRRRRVGGRMPGSRLFSWRGGVGMLPRALARYLGSAVYTGVAVRRLRPLAGGFEIDTGVAGTVSARAVVVATQPHVAAQLLEGVDAAAAAAAGGIEAPPLAVVFLGFKRDRVAHPLDGLGFLTSQSEGRMLSGAQFCSTMFPERAPGGCVAVAGYIGGARAPELARLPAADLIELARGEFADLIGTKGEPVVARVRHWPLGLPQYGPGHEDRVTSLTEAARRRPGLFVTGNYLGGISVDACLGQARDTAARVRDHVRGVPAGTAVVDDRGGANRQRRAPAR